MGDVRDTINSITLRAYIPREADLPFLLRLGLSLLLLTVPFHSVLILPGVSVVKAIGVVLAPIWLIWLMGQLGAPCGPWTMPRRNVRLILAFGLFIASILLSAFYASPSPIFRTSLTTIVSDCAMALVICTLVSSEALLRRAYACLAVGGTVLAFLVILQFVAPQRVAGFLGQHIFVETIGEEKVLRATGPFRDPNYGALALIVLACLTLYLALTLRKRWQRTALLFAVGLQIVAILLTFSRGGYITLALVGLGVLWRERHRFRLWKVTLVAMTGLVLLATVGEGIVDLVASRAKTVVEFGRLLREAPGQAYLVDLSLWYRFQLFQAGIRMAIDKFPLGVGWENFRYSVTQYSAEVREQGAHNAYVAVAAELGLPGLISLTWLLLLLWGGTGRICKAAEGEMQLLARGIRYGLLAILIGGLFLTIFHEAVVWALIGLIMAQYRVISRAKSRKIKSMVEETQ